MCDVGCFAIYALQNAGTDFPARFQQDEAHARKVSSVSLGVYMFHLLLVNLTLGGPIGGFITLGQTHPFIKAIVVYALTGIAVYIGKWIIAKIKQIASSR